MWQRAAAASACAVALVAAEPRDHCTAIAAGAKATKDGSTLVGQTVDFEGGPGSSFLYVPAQTHKPGSMRDVLDQETQEKIGEIPQVNYTYAYTWASYGVMNEYQLAFGESTTSGRLAANSLAHNGTALFSNQELTKIALERCKTSRCAIETMGAFALRGGFYGEGFDVDTGSENLVVADPKEAWVFHIMADPTGHSAVWAAQRVPDDSVAIVPNAWIIREMDLDSKDFYLSPNAMSIAKEYGWWDGKGKFNWAKTFGLGEYEHPYYGARRIWRAYDLLAPSLKLDPSKEITPESGGYPFAIKPDEKMSASDVFRIYRDYLEGTPFSLVKEELAAGPFATPRRVAGDKTELTYKVGGWERPISIYRNDYAVVSECRTSGHGVVWVAPHTPHASVFAPVWSSASTAVPRPYFVDKKKKVDQLSLFWASSAISNWAQAMFSEMIVDIRKRQAEIEVDSLRVARMLASSDSDASMHTKIIDSHAMKVHESWWEFFFELMAKYSDGYIIERDASGATNPKAVGYPAWYLKAVDYEHAVVGATPEQYKALADRMKQASEEFAKIDALRPHSHVDAASAMAQAMTLAVSEGIVV
eukprot:TRINITY_DN80841_c0_g1_i1.p1 TRINITY_DN80841_c0_g1~~TRINITY_DN80841_c0_g1_i1.p1  ORF type:complete len:588 (+),score=127.48 TRINITY_DN80841_c0_g1_i1:109-1872(+)